MTIPSRVGLQATNWGTSVELWEIYKLFVSADSVGLVC